MRKLSSQAYLTTFTLLVLLTTATYAYAQVPGMEEVSGTYTNSDAGVTITFPDDWSGSSFAVEETTIVTVLPGGMESGETDKAITLIVVDKSQVEGDPTDPTSYSEEAPECNIPTPTERTVSGKKGFEMIMECTDDSGVTSKIKMTVAETSDRWIAAMYSSPLAEFDADVGKYDASVDSLQIEGAVDASIPNMPSDGGTGDGEMESMTMPVTVGGESINVAVQSASTISAFALDETAKTISFTADGTGDETIVSVGSVLEGPYTVMVDGTAATGVEESTDSSGVKTLTVPHSSGSHEVTITGTQVVPEFPFAMLGIVGALVAIVTIVGRSRLFKHRL